MPKRKFENLRQFNRHVIKAEELIFDGTENLINRPQNSDIQKNKYSGKKKAHTDISLLLSDKKTWIYYLSELYDGSNVDMGILKKEFPPEVNWFKKKRVLFDLGFVGVDKIYKIKEVVIGERKARKSKKNPNPELSEVQKIKNQKVSKERIFVEHAIGKMKRYRILKNKCRIKCQNLKNKIIGVCAGLWNYHLMINR